MNPFIWDPDPVAFTLPFIGRPIMWYGVLFALGFFFAYLIVLQQLKRFYRQDPDLESELELSKKAQKVIDKLLICVGVSLLLGARIFHVLFYESDQILFNPLKALNAWEGGLASHGGVAGALIGLIIAVKLHKTLFSQLGTLKILDLFVPAAAILGTCIRLGNFINQEVLGKAYTGLFSVLFLSPIDGSLAVSRHPVQLYEAIFFALMALLTPGLKSLLKRFGQGALAGCFITLTFIFRFWIEDFKIEQSQGFESSLNMGAWLSLPMILIGILLMAYAFFKGPLKADPGLGE
jgi:phosphatidylglycerol---prolipoprotein diacylglyceryl transferase